MECVSLLDRLKREGDQQRASQELLTRERDSRDALYKNEIEPRMKGLVTYLEALVATLNEVKPQVVVKMPIAGYGDLGAQPIWDFRIEHDRRYRNFIVSLDWTLRVDPEHTPVVRAEGVTKIKTLIAAFHKFHLGGVKEEKRNKSGELLIAHFHARGHIKARIEAKISADDPVLRMVLSNASWLGSSQRQFIWQQVNDELCDRIARFIVREDDSLFTEEVNDALRQQLRKDGDAYIDGAVPVVKTVAFPIEDEVRQVAASGADAAKRAAAEILHQLDPAKLPNAALTRLTEPDAPILPSLEELNAAFSATPAKPLEVLPLGVPGANAEPIVPAASPAIIEQVASPAQPIATVPKPTPSMPNPAAAQPAPTPNLATSATLARDESSLAPGIIPKSQTLEIGENIPGDDSGKPEAPSLFMSRMNLTLQRLREDEDGAGK